MDTHDNNKRLPDAGAEHLEKLLVERYGPLLAAEDVIEILSFPNANAYRQAIKRGSIPIPMFHVSGRTGRFALASDMAAWLWSQRGKGK